MRRVGFSTGAIAKGDFLKALRVLESLGDATTAIELSALREDELGPLIEAVPRLDLQRFEYVSLHAPSTRQRLSECEYVQQLVQASKLIRNIVVHPDVIEDPQKWDSIQRHVVLENMDQRKSGARTAGELQRYFDVLPNARFCFDIGHARQVDPTLTVAVELIRAFVDRLAEIHISEVDAASKHVAISSAVMDSYRRIASIIPDDVPVIIESMVPLSEMENEIQVAIASLDDRLQISRERRGTVGCSFAK